MDERLTILQGDCRETLKTLPDESVNCCVTSPPYFNLRCYGHEKQIGKETTPKEFVVALVELFREVRRVLRGDGTLWLNLGDSYAANRTYQVPSTKGGQKHSPAQGDSTNNRVPDGMKPKDLIGIPWMVAFALREDGWYLRSDIVWAKTNCMPESVKDRPTRSHEYIFLLAKSETYFYDCEAIKEKAVWDVNGTGTSARKARAEAGLKSHPEEERNGIRPAGFKDAKKFGGKQHEMGRRFNGFNERWANGETVGMRNKRDVWNVSPAQYKGAHFAVFPSDLIEPCILAGCPRGGVVLDPFGGSGTTGQVAIQHGRKAILCELNPEYVNLIHQRCQPHLDTQNLFDFLEYTE